MLSDYVKGCRSYIQYGLVEPLLGESVSPLIHGIFFQFQEFHIADVIFQLVGRVRNDQVIDVFYGIRIRDTIAAEEGYCI